MTPFPDIDCNQITFTTCDCSTTISGAVMDIEEGYVQGADTLTCTACPAGITANFDTSTGIMTLTGDATITEYAAALASIQFKTTSGNGASRRVTYNYGHAMYSTVTGHFYEYYSSDKGYCKDSQGVAGKCHWDQGQTECALESHDILGLVGYLVTITDATEQKVASEKLHGQGWIGSGDVAKEGEWRWLTGPEGCPPYNTAVTGPQRSACDLGYPLPESKTPCTGVDCGKGTLFGTGTGSGFVVANGEYNNWASGEPNEYSRPCPGTCDTTGEDYGHYYSDGTWNDYPNGHDNIEGFVCEWGGVGDLCMSPDDVYGTQVLIAGCYVYDNIGACEAHQPAGSCKWDDTQNPAVCVENGCHAYDNEGSCEADLLCDWDLTKSPAECVDAYCPNTHKAKDACNADTLGPCYWNANNPAGAECQKRVCGDITDKCDCLAASPDCIWDSANTHCVDPNVRCPPVDIVFLLDASASMTARFGSHAVGFYGMMEEMRDFLHGAELAPSKDATYGIRASMVQFGKPGEAQTAQDTKPAGFTDCKPWVPVTGTTGGGAPLSGDYSKLSNDVTFHENFFCRDWSQLRTILEPGLLEAEKIFSGAGTRKKIVMIVTDGALHDKDADIRTVEDRLKTNYDAQVFGIVVRKAVGHTNQDRQAEAKLKPLVSDPQDEHFINVDLDHFKEQVLDTICDPNSVFGKGIAAGTVTVVSGCAPKATETDCMADLDCKWDASISPSCTQSECYPLCTETDCNAHPGCKWDGKDCKREETGCTAKNEADCKADDTCMWDPMWATNTCIDNPCRVHDEEQSCEAVAVEMGAPCNPPAGDPDYCFLSVCEYDPNKSPKCNPKKCLHTKEGDCNAEDGCEWVPVQDPPPAGPPSTLVEYCAEKICQYVSDTTCNADTKCEWDTALDKCVERPCVKHPDEASCNADTACHWDTTGTPPVCTQTPCGGYPTQQACENDDKCMWQTNANPAYCAVKTCEKYNYPKDECKCNEDPDCVWVSDPTNPHCAIPSMAQCPDLDVAFVIDGSGSMWRSFGRHAHGFTALLEMLRDWVKTLPLTGEDHTVKAASTVTGGTFRITFIQFSKANARPDEDHPTNCAVGQCTDGLLSGNLQELMGDIDWHEANYQRQWTYIHDALQDVADTTFLPANSPPHRKHVVVIIADGGLTDIDGDACSAGNPCGQCPWGCDQNWQPTYPGMLDKAQQDLRVEGVIVFGVVMRRFTQHTYQDDYAELRLKPLVTDPKDDHFMNLQLDEIPSQLLDKFCDPSSPIGRSLIPPVDSTHFPCATWGFQDECNADKYCEWKQPKLSTCDSPTGCPTLNCQAVPAQYAGMYQCDNCKLQRATIICGAGVVSAIDGTCASTSCKECCDKDCCDKDPACMWSGTPAECTRKVCEYTDKTNCEGDKDSLCVWDDNTKDCSKKPCEAIFVKDACLNKTGECMWDTGVDPPVCKSIPTCDGKSKADCIADPKCTHNCTSDVCRDSRCLYTTSATCSVDSSCEWINGACSEKPCTYTTQQPCDAAGCENCKWNTNSQQCEEDKCKVHDNANDCNQDPLCVWDGMTPCVTDYCPSYGNDLVGCDHDPRCHWNTTTMPASCQPTECTIAHNTKYPPSSTVADTCASDPNCKKGTDAKGDYCETAKCSDHLTNCECTKNPDCYWDSTTDPKCRNVHVSACPDLDVVFVLDGSGSMSATFGNHPHGYYGMVEMLRDWMQTLPLTGEDHTVGAASSVTGGTFRLAFVQFSRTDEYWVCKNTNDGCSVSTRGCDNPTPTGTCTDGQLSGDLNELNVDLDWHETNYMKSVTYMAKALEDAVTVFGGSPSHRAHVLIVITDGAMNPKEPQSSTEIPPIRQSLDAMNVITFGVVVRKNAQHTKADLDAEKTLKPITSDPHTDHFMNVDMDELADENGPLTKMCDPTTGWGSALALQPTGGEHMPCRKYDGKTSCMTDRGCVWSETLLGCVNSPCVVHCDQAMCDGDLTNGCVGGWNDQEKTCYRKEVCGGDILSCETEEGCEWNATASDCMEKRCHHKTEDSCLADTETVCLWKDPETCVVMPCVNYLSQGECTQDTANSCLWTGDNKCVQDKCVYTEEDKCRADPLCDWQSSNQTCTVRPCVEYTDDKTCDADRRCHWDTSTSPGSCQLERCAKYPSKDMCEADAGCLWEDNVCVERTCHKLTERCACQQDPTCFWSNTGGRGRCEEQAYGKCPTLDVALVLDGSGSMSQSFGRHPHGFYAPTR
eukprot:TRINITY_DN2_c0_g1_i6.p1 TRINITY_DN2_c0_g1~~TRINITY_DN2_c0_g1_i6.p1  ORF type:complete len:2288 (+),score=601.89 TRINITY_DN2_c0_g1_i6:192-6866(+)